MDITKFMREPVLINESATFKEAVEVMTKTHSNSLLVVDDQDKLVGGVDIVTLIKKTIPEYLEHEKNVAHFTTESVFKDFISEVENVQLKDFLMPFNKVITPKTSLMEAAIIVTEGRQTKIPVLDENEKPLGVFSRGSLKKLLAAELGLS